MSFKLCLSVLKHIRISNIQTNNYQMINTRNIKRWVAPTLKEIHRRKKKLEMDKMINPRSSFLEWNLNAELFAFSKRLNENFDQALLQQAFTHRSFIFQEEKNQREAGIDHPVVDLIDNLELGKSGYEFLSNYIQKFLKESLPNFPSDGQKAVHDHLTSEEFLSNIALNLGTKDLILSSEYPPEKSTLATTFNAIIGALLTSADEKRTENFIKDIVLTHLNDLDVNDLWTINDPMGLLKDILNKNGQGDPEPRLINETGKNTLMAAYRVGIYSDKKLIAIGNGETISIATEMAARESLKEFFNTQTNLMFKFNVPDSLEERMDKKSSQNKNS